MEMLCGPGLGGCDGDAVWSWAGRTQWRYHVVRGWEDVMEMPCGPGLGGCDGDAVCPFAPAMNDSPFWKQCREH